MRKSFGMFAVLLFGLLSSQWAKADTCSTTSGQLVTNCGFETGNFTGWTLKGYSTSAISGYVGVDSSYPDQGSYSAYIGTPSAETITQSIGTTAGTTYDVSFDLLNEPDPTGQNVNDFTAMFGTEVLVSETNVAGDSNFPLYTLYSGSFKATGGSTLLSFGGTNANSYFDFDNVSVTAETTTATTPEPGSILLFGTGLVGLAGAARRRFTK